MRMWMLNVLVGLTCFAIIGLTTASTTMATGSVSGPIYYGYTVDSLLSRLAAALNRGFSPHLPDGKYLAYALSSLESAFDLDMGYEDYISQLNDQERLGRGVPQRVRPGSQGMVWKSAVLGPAQTPQEKLNRVFQVAVDLNTLASGCSPKEKAWNEGKAADLLSRLPAEFDARRLRVITMLHANKCVGDAWFARKAPQYAALVAARQQELSDEELLLSVTDLLRGGFGAYLTAEHVERLVEEVSGRTDERFARNDMAMLEAYALASLVAAHNVEAAMVELRKYGKVRRGGSSGYCDDPDSAPEGVDLSMCVEQGEGP